VAVDRFNAYLLEQYGGSKSVREVIRTGKMVDVKLGQVQSETRAQIPQPKLSVDAVR
jgi:hypothetical protein